MLAVIVPGVEGGSPESAGVICQPAHLSRRAPTLSEMPFNETSEKLHREAA